MNTELSRTVAGLSAAGPADISALGREIRSRVSAGDCGWAGELGAELATRASGADSRENYGSVLGNVLRALAAEPGPDSLRELLRVPASLSTDATEQVLAERRLALLIAHGHRIEDVERTVFAEGNASVHSGELTACLVHEYVLTGAPLESFPGFSARAASLVAEGHPLGALPPALLPLESGLRRPPNAGQGWTWTMPPWYTAPLATQPLKASASMRQRTAAVDLTEISGPAHAEAAGAAVQHWCAQSNGKIAAQEFWTPDPVRAEDFPAVLERLPLTAWPVEEGPAEPHPATPDTVFRMLLTAAVRAPAYGSGLHGAYGRLAAWHSLAGLTGVPADMPLARVAEEAGRTTWLRIAPSSSWFHEVAWDLAVAALHPDGQGIAVLAATDTD
ncbi:hypothetical protein KME66_30825 [Streptomyces sp. YPW6]|uniref:DUF6183 family protein n=1 Tax=Streptomyces sp. YPW6 TaxID=2840373 RepID=UPI001C0CA0AE|nr:DUF6183 family protein [Streptomyces sp. YPW6]QWQ44888.1 hypothetical protein KME66_30825 [Streptomyces sp. YPW6]